MWFKNLRLYRLPAPWDISLTTLEAALARYPFAPCGSFDTQSKGWVAPWRDGSLVYSQQRHWLLSLRTEQKLLPASIINELAAERADEIAVQQGYAPGRKQRREIKERVTEELLPRALARRRSIHVWIDPLNGWLGIDAASPARADEVLELLGKSLDNLPLALVKTDLSPTTAMADWLAAGEGPDGFTIDRDCELKSMMEDKAVVRYVRHPLDGEEIRDHLAAGKQPTRLALTWDERISFVLTETMDIKRLAFLDVLKEQAEGETLLEDEQFAADFALMAGELSRFIPELLAALGGEQDNEQQLAMAG